MVSTPICPTGTIPSLMEGFQRGNQRTPSRTEEVKTIYQILKLKVLHNVKGMICLITMRIIIITMMLVSITKTVITKSRGLTLDRVTSVK